MGATLSGVSVVGVGLAVRAQYGGVEAGCAVDFPLQTAAGVKVHAVKHCTAGAGQFLLAPKEVVFIVEASGTLGT